MNFINILKRIAQSPEIFIGERSIKRLDGFLCGYAVCLQDHGLKDADELNFQGFQNFVNKKYSTNKRWTRTLLELFGDEYNAFNEFVQLLNEYLKENDI